MRDEPNMKLNELIYYLSVELHSLGDDFVPNECYHCRNDRIVCPGCTRGRIRIEYEELFMGCGVRIRCPVCVDPIGVAADVAFFRPRYNRNDEESESQQRARYLEMEDEILEKYPNWTWPEDD
jgi:hypothetical protein